MPDLFVNIFRLGLQAVRDLVRRLLVHHALDRPLLLLRQHLHGHPRESRLQEQGQLDHALQEDEAGFGQHRQDEEERREEEDQPGDGDRVTHHGAAQGRLQVGLDLVPRTTTCPWVLYVMKQIGPVFCIASLTPSLNGGFQYILYDVL